MTTSIIYNNRKGFKVSINNVDYFQPEFLKEGDELEVSFRPTSYCKNQEEIDFSEFQIHSEYQVNEIFSKLHKIIGNFFQRESSSYIGGYEYLLYTEKENNPFQYDFIGTLTIRCKNIKM